MKRRPFFPSIQLLGIAAALIASCGASGAQADILEQLDFDDGVMSRLTETGQSDKFHITDVDSATQSRRLFTVRTLGRGNRPELSADRGNGFVRFASDSSSTPRDRSEIIVDQHLEEDRTYTVAYRLRIPRSDAASYLSEGQWFTITQIQEVGGVGSPPLLVRLRREGDGIFMDVIGRNRGDRFQRLISVPLDDPANFTFGEWNDIRLHFRMGADGFVELAIGNSHRRMPLRSFGSVRQQLTFDRREDRYVLRMGLYRGGDRRRDAYHVDMDDIVLSTP